MANKISELPNGNLTQRLSSQWSLMDYVKTTLGDVTTALQSTLSVGGEVGFISITKQKN
jgi:hypothetical protein